MCFKKACSFSQYAHPALAPWVEMFAHLQSEIVKHNGLGREMLRRAKALTPDVVEAMVGLERAANKHYEDEREREMQARKR